MIPTPEVQRSIAYADERSYRMSKTLYRRLETMKAAAPDLLRELRLVRLGIMQHQDPDVLFGFMQAALPFITAAIAKAEGEAEPQPIDPAIGSGGHLRESFGMFYTNPALVAEADAQQPTPEELDEAGAEMDLQRPDRFEE